MREDWVKCTLGEICDINMGQSPPSSTYNTEGIGLPFFQGKAEFTNLHPVVKKWCSAPKKIAYKNDILLSVRAPVGSTNLADQECAIGRGLAAITYKYNTAFIWYYLKLIESKLDSQGTGTTFRAISGNILKNQIIKLPPLVEQRAIIAKIEELFSSLDSGIADLKKAQDQLVIYRQAVLKRAFEGDWENYKLGTLIVEGPTNGMYKPKSFYGSGTSILRIDGFYDGKINPWKSLKKLELERDELETYSLKNNDIVINRVNSMPYVGKSAVVKNLVEDCVFESNIMRLRIDEKIILPTYLVSYLISPNGFKELQKNVKHAVNQSSINQTDVKNAIVPIPSLKEQHQIIQEIESRLSVCDNVENSIKESLIKAQALRQSILKKAFEGKLLNEDEIAKCKAAPDYEPASVLLEKIKAEKKKK